MPNNPTIVSASLDDKELQASINKMVANFDKGLQDMLDHTNTKVKEINEALKGIGNVNFGAKGSNDGAVVKQTKAQNAETTALEKSNQAAKEKTMTLDQQASVINTVVQSEKKYTDEVLRQAAAIRSSKEWQEKGHVVIGDVNYYDKERANVSKRDKQLLLSLEEQIVQAKQNEAEAERRVAQETRNQAQAQQQVQQSALGTARIIESVHEMQRRSANFQKGNASVPTFTVELESAKRLSDRLKELREQYNNMNFGQRFGKEGQVIAQQIREIARQGQRLNNELNRPTKKEAFGLSEKTLDDIAYKMRQLSAYRGGLDASKQSKEIAQVNDEYNRLKKRMDEVMQKNQQMIASNTTLGRSWNYMKNRLAFYFTVGAGTAFIKNLIEVRSQYEMNERALGILVNSAERGTQIFNELSQMALVSPYTLIELSAAAKQLTAYDVAAKDVVDTTRRLADMAAAVGIPIERLTYALGQIKAYGYLNARDARMFANAGIPLVKQLSEYYTELEGRLVSTADIYDRIKKKSIGYEEVTSVIAKMTDEGGKFYDFQAKMAETLKVQLANLTLAWNNMLNAMGEESQGVLVAGIGTLKQVFLHWKDIEHVLYELVVALGAYKAYQIITTRLMGATAASLDAQVLAMKRNKAAMLEKQALTRKLTVDELRQVAAQNQVTAADYRNALSGKQLTKQKALLLVALNKNNVQLKAAVVNMGLLTTQEVANITTGRALAIVFKSIGISIKNVALAIKAFAASMLPLLVLGAIYELYHAWDSYGEHVKEVNKQAAEHAKEAFENIKQYLESDVTSALQDRLSKGGKVESDAAGQKAWDEMREKIELSSSASNAFIAKLMQISDINARLSAGFGYLEDIQRVAGVMQTLEKDAVKVSSTVLGGLFEEGLKDDLEDFIDSYEEYVSLSENLKQNGVGEKYFNDIKDALEELRGEIDKTTNSIYDIASKEGFNTNEQREFFEREISEIAQAEQMGAKETRIFRMQAEKEYYAYARAQLVAQLEYQQGAQKAATEKRIKDLDNEFGTNKALQESFFTWLTEKQDHAVKNMLRGKTQEEIKQGEWLKGSNAKWVEEMARKFSKEYNVSFDDLRRLVLQANTWSINIPVFFQTIGQPLSDVQRDYEARTGKKFSSNPLIKDAKTQVEILDTLKKKQKEVANEMATAEKAGGKYWEDNKQRYKEENDALVADIHAYNALTDAEEKANKKSGKGGSKKDPLLDAIKQEISLVEKLQGDYDKLAKSGASQSDALDTIRSAYGKTIRLLNTQLQSYGLPQINISQLITGKDPNKALAHFKQTLDTLVSKGMLTLGRSKELEAVVEKFTLSAKTYNLDMITKGLNNELGKLKDEYELAVELDANPEIGGMFADWMGIDMSELPHTAEEYAKRMTKALNKYLAEEKSGIEIGNILALTDDDLRMFQQRVDNQELNQVWVDTIVKNTKEARAALKKENSEIAKDWDNIVQKYAEYEYKIAQIQRNTNKERKNFALKYGTDEQKERAVVLTTEIDAEKDQAKKQELINQLKQLLDDIAGDDETKLKIKVAIDKKGLDESARVSFEEFQKSPDWIVATGDLAGMTDKAIGMLIESIEKYKVTAKNLSPKQIKQLNRALVELYKKQREGNPFKALSTAMMEAKNRVSVYEDELKETQDELDELTKKQAKSFSAERAKDIDAHIKKIKELKEKIEEGAELKATNIVEGLQGMVSTANAVSSAVGDMWEAFGGSKEVTEQINGVFTVLDSTLEKAQLGAQIGGKWGAIAGAVVGLFTGLGQVFGGGKDDITLAIERSERSVKQLEIAYKRLEVTIEEAYGAAKWGAEQAAIANKKLQLAELKRQLALERSRDSKDRDEGKINDLMGQIEDLKIEIEKSIKDITNDLLGISSVGNAAEELVSSMIDAFRKGEDYMLHYDQTFEEMINNMVMKSIVGRVIGDRLQSLWDRIDAVAKEKGEPYQKQIDALMAARKKNEDSMETLNNSFLWGAGVNKAFFDKYDKLKQNNERIDEEIKKLQKQYSDAIAPTPEDVQSVRDDAANWRDSVKSEFEAYMELFGIKFGDSADGKQLSSLQQGIQSVTEETASAVEAYLNGMSQQAYLRNDLLTQIRDAVIGMDMDVQVATQAQILLQLQSSYQIQMSIRDTLQGWSNASGMAVRVEMV